MSKVTRKDAYAYAEVLREYVKTPGKEFGYVVARNVHKVDTIAAETDKLVALPFDQRVSDYETEIVKLCEKFCDKDAEGNLIHTEDNKYQIKDQEGFKAELEVLKAANPEVIALITEHNAKVQEVLNEEVDIEWVIAPDKIVPETITGEDILILEFMLERKVS